MKILPVLFCFFVSVSYGQKKGLPLEGAIQVGLLEGQAGGAMQIGVMGGVKVKTWTTSLGTGLDYYGVRSVPLYLQVQKKIFDRGQTPFVFVSGGHHFPWLEQSNREDSWGSVDVSGRLYYAGGVGYQLPVLKTAALFFTAGYSFKQYEEEVTMGRFCIGGNCPNYVEKYEYRLRRLSITTGLRF